MSINQNKSVLVTGSAKRLGRVIAKRLAEEGFELFIHYGSSSEEAQSLAEEIKENGGKAHLLKADLGNVEGLDNLIEQAYRLSGNLEAIINNASIFPTGKLEEITYEDLEKNIRINTWAPLALSRSFYRICKRGCVVNILDARIKSLDRNHFAYIMSKKLLKEVTEILAIELAPEVRVNAVAPGAILPPPGKNEEYLKKISEITPLKRHGDPLDIAEAVLFLLKNEYITGQVIYVDGGRHLLK